MTATARRRGAAILDHWHRAESVRDEWLRVGLATEPADRQTAEHLVTRFYRRHGRGRPRFVWVDSPGAALGHTTGIPGHDDLHAWLRPNPPTGRPPVVLDMAAAWSRTLAALDEAADHPDLDPPSPARKGDKPPPNLPPVAALEAGVPLRVVLRRGVREELRGRLLHEVALPVRSALGPPARLPVCWYGQQDASWIAYHDVLRRSGLSRPAPRDAADLDDWAALAHATGWWWPGEEVCTMVERPARIEPGAHVRYRDGQRFG